MFKHQDLQMYLYISNFHSLEAVGRGSETQLPSRVNFKFYNLAL